MEVELLERSDGSGSTESSPLAASSCLSVISNKRSLSHGGYDAHHNLIGSLGPKIEASYLDDSHIKSIVGYVLFRVQIRCVQLHTVQWMT